MYFDIFWPSWFCVLSWWNFFIAGGVVANAEVFGGKVMNSVGIGIGQIIRKGSVSRGLGLQVATLYDVVWRLWGQNVLERQWVAFRNIRDGSYAESILSQSCWKWPAHPGVFYCTAGAPCQWGSGPETPKLLHWLPQSTCQGLLGSMQLLQCCCVFEETSPSPRLDRFGQKFRCPWEAFLVLHSKVEAMAWLLQIYPQTSLQTVLLEEICRICRNAWPVTSPPKANLDAAMQTLIPMPSLEWPGVSGFESYGKLPPRKESVESRVRYDSRQIFTCGNLTTCGH